MFRDWVDLRPNDFTALDSQRTVVLMPVGAIEQHGPHLPLGVDGFINDAVVQRMRAAHRFEEDILVLPTCWVGRSEEHAAFPGCLYHSADTLRQMWFDLGSCVARSGLRKLIIFNSHGGQIQVMQIVARELRIAHMMFVVPASWFQLGLPEGLVAEGEARHGIHAGDIETSMMLKISPDLVFEQEFENFIPSTKRNESMFPILTSMGAAGFGWQAQDLHPKGACGDARKATSEKGEKLISHAADRLAELIAEVASYPLSELRGRDASESLG